MKKKVESAKKSYNRISKDISNVLNDYRTFLEMSNKEFAKFLGIPLTRLESFLSGTYDFSLEEIAILEEAMNVQICFTRFDFSRKGSRLYNEKAKIILDKYAISQREAKEVEQLKGDKLAVSEGLVNLGYVYLPSYKKWIKKNNVLYSDQEEEMVTSLIDDELKSL